MGSKVSLLREVCRHISPQRVGCGLARDMRGRIVHEARKRASASFRSARRAELCCRAIEPVRACAAFWKKRSHQAQRAAILTFDEPGKTAGPSDVFVQVVLLLDSQANQSLVPLSDASLVRTMTKHSMSVRPRRVSSDAERDERA